VGTYLSLVLPLSACRSLNEYGKTGIMAYTKLGDPLVGPVLDASNHELAGQWISAGYSGHGMPRAFSWYGLVCSENILN
jgi:hypothetical protein